MITSSTLRIIACLAMIVDHIFAHLLKGSDFYSAGRMVGRVAFILFAYMIGQGMIYTHSKFKYIGRLLILALISEPLFDLCNFDELYNFTYQNTIWTLLLGAIAIWALQSFLDKPFIVSVIVALCAGTAFLIKTDYSAAGVVLVVLLYIFRYDILKAATFGFLIFVFLLGLSHTANIGGAISSIEEAFMDEIFGLTAFILLYFYEGKKGVKIPKFLYYLVYPAHLAIIFIIRCLC